MAIRLVYLWWPLLSSTPVRHLSHCSSLDDGDDVFPISVLLPSCLLTKVKFRSAKKLYWKIRCIACPGFKVLIGLMRDVTIPDICVDDRFSSKEKSWFSYFATIVL